jgi:hypothetical protein
MKMFLGVLQRAFVAFSLVGIVACAGVPELVPVQSANPSSSSGEYDDPGLGDGSGGDSDNPDDNSGGPTDGGGSVGSGGGGSNNPDPCASAQTLNASLQPSSAEKLNVMLLIDDSGSMAAQYNGQPSTISRVVTNLQSFIQSLTSAVSNPNDLRLGLMFSTNQNSVFGGSNPFTPYLSGSTVFHINEQTNSQASDLAMFRRFAQPDFYHVLPNPFPTDVRYFPNTFSAVPICNSNAYNRPTRHNLSISGGTTAYCNNPSAQPSQIENFFHEGALNLISVTDDDLNTSYGADANDPEGAHFVYNMYQTLTAPLGANFIYHSIVGTTTSDFAQTGDAANIVRPGTVHMMLSQLTGGSVFDVRTSNYGPVLQSLARQAIFSSQTVNLVCPVVPSRTPRVYFDGQEVSPSHFETSAGSTSILFLPTAFSPGDESRMIAVTVEY